MAIVGIGKETYLYVNGISCLHEIALCSNLILKPVNSKFDFKKISLLIDNDIDYSVIVLSSVNLFAQLQIKASSSEELAVKTWNAQWDCLLLGALFNCDVMSNIQCDVPVEKQENASYLYVTNYAFHAILTQCYQLSTEDEIWINKYYCNATFLLNEYKFQTAVHAMATYRWHSLPSVQMAVIWSGIESLFNVNSEISFRLSLYIARFVAEDDDEKARKIFLQTKKLYKYRSDAVHGNKIKEGFTELVKESALLLNKILKCCCEKRKLPNVEELVFYKNGND